jgi:hypothetical protein
MAHYTLLEIQQMETTQYVLTLAFNIICIGYTTLALANFVCGLCEEWMKPRNTDTTNVTPEVEEEKITDEPITIPQGWDVVEPVNYTIRELKELAKQRHIPKYGNMTKSQLMSTLF